MATPTAQKKPAAPKAAAPKTAPVAQASGKVRHSQAAQHPALLIMRIRGSSHSRHTVEQALHQLHLNRRCHATIANAKNAPRGVLQKVKDYVAWGPADAATIELLLTKRGELKRGQKMTDATLAKTYSGYKTISELANALASGKVYLAQVEGVQPCIRLTPPKGGFGGTIKTPVNSKGALGDHGDKISKLAASMV
ncbi:50S ribosomal protein L30 [uncultured archaeon]|nr:50S ribosomal protein L30 [uncultured archaeon]